MKRTTCALCGENICIDENTACGQHILCPFCGGKFSYLADSSAFSPERLTYAIAECRKNADDSRYYNEAPSGARMYIGMIFYGKVFKEETDVDQYMSVLSSVESELKLADWEYLLKREPDGELAAYFRGKVDALRGPDSHEQGAIEATGARKTVAEPAAHAPVKPISRPKGGASSREDRRAEIAERRRLAEAQQQEREWRQKLVGRVVLTLCLMALAAVGCVLYVQMRQDIRLESSHGTEADRRGNVQRETPVRHADQAWCAVTNGLETLRARRQLLKESMVEIRKDRHRLNADVARIIEQGNVKSAESQARGRLRLNGAETAMLVLKSTVYNELAGRYLGERPFARADECRRKIQAGLDAGKVPAKAELEGIEQLAIAFQEGCVGELRRTIDERERLFLDMSRKTTKAIESLSRDQLSVRDLGDREAADKVNAIGQMLREESLVKDCTLAPMAALPGMRAAKRMNLRCRLRLGARRRRKSSWRPAMRWTGRRGRLHGASSSIGRT